MPENDSTPRSTPQYDDLEFNMAGGDNYDPINEDITKPAPSKINMGLPKGMSMKGLEGLSGVVDPRIMPENNPNTAQLKHLLKGGPEDINPISHQGIKNFLINTQAQGMDVKSDPFKGGKRVMLDLHDANNMNQFYDRYAAHSDFEKLGFSPFRDNEKLYNQNTSFWEEIGRASGEWSSLMWTGFKDAAGFGEMTDLKAAEEFERAMAVGQSTVGGATGFTTNLFLNSGYTVGIMAELAAEEIAMALGEIGLGIATVGSVGTASGATLPGMALLAGRMGYKATSAFSKISKAWKAGGKMMKAFDNMKDINKARQYFNSSVKGFANVINPLDNTMDFFRGVEKMDDVNNWVKTYRGFGSFYKDVRNVRLAYGEGALEGGMVYNEMTRDMLSEFKAEHGRMPNEEEANKIHSTAKTASVNTAFWNMPLIMFSNKLTFDGLVRGRFSNLSKDLVEVAGRKAIFNPKKGVKEAFQLQPKNWFKAKWNYLKTPSTWLKEGALYSKANIAEGLQELGQETLSASFKNYELAKHKGDPLRGGYYSFLGDAMNEQVSWQGLETFASGFLMGGMIAPISNTVAATTQGGETTKNLYKRVFKNEEWTKLRDEKDAKAAETINKLNKFYEDPRQYLSGDLENMQAQVEYQKAAKVASENGDRKLYEDVMDASMVDHVKTAIGAGRFDTFIERMEEMKGLSKEEAVEYMQGKSYQDYQNNLDANIRKAKNIQKRHKYFASKRQNPFNPSKYKKVVNGQTNPQYVAEVTQHNAWNNAIDEAVFHQSTFDRALERQTEVLAAAKENSGLSEAAYGEYNVLFDFKNIQSEIDLLKIELEGLNEKSKDKIVRDSVKDRSKKLKALEDYADALQDMLSNPGENESIPEAQYKKMQKAYNGFVKYLAEKNGDYPNYDQKDQSLDLLLNWYTLEGRKKPAMDAVNILLDPKGFNQGYERHKEVQDLKMADKKAEIAESLKQYRAKQETNQMLNALADEGMFFDVNELEKLEKEGIAPTKFYYTNDQGNNDQVVRNTDDYMKAINIISKYNAITHNIDITNEDGVHPYQGMSRAKNKNDKRTYEDLAKQFGFDPKKPSTRVPLRQVLESIADPENKYTTEAEKELAKELLKDATDQEFVTFSNRETVPGAFTDMAQTVIDARYSSENYKYGKEGHPLEHIILKEEVGRRIQDKIEKDKEFADQLDLLRNEALEAYQKLSQEDKDKFFVGPLAYQFNLIDAKEFAKAAMTNERFQTFLGRVTSKMETKTVWERFVDAVLKGLEKGFGVRVSGTVLNAAMDLITSKISSTPMSPSVTPTSTKTTTTEKAQKAGERAGGAPPVDLGGEIPEAVLAAQNPKKLRKSVGGKMIDALRELGYSETQIAEFKRKGAVVEAQRIIDNVITVTDYNQEKTPAPDTAREQAALDTKEEIANLIQMVIDTQDYTVWRASNTRIEELIREDAMLVEESYKTDELSQIMLDLKAEIANKDVTFDELIVGEHVILNYGNEPVAKVISKNSELGIITLQYITGAGKEFEISAEEVSEKIKFRDRDMDLSTEEKVPEATPEQQENIEASSKIAETPAEKTKELVEKAKEISADDALNNLINNTCK